MSESEFVVRGRRPPARCAEGKSQRGASGSSPSGMDVTFNAGVLTYGSGRRTSGARAVRSAASSIGMRTPRARATAMARS